MKELIKGFSFAITIALIAASLTASGHRDWAFAVLYGALVWVGVSVGVHHRRRSRHRRQYRRDVH